MAVRPSQLADRMSATRRQSSEEFTLPVDAARNKAREVINQSAPSRLVPIVENWRQLPTVRFSSRCAAFRKRTDGPQYLPRRSPTHPLNGPARL
jgi:hypothetical protein